MADGVAAAFMGDAQLLQSQFEKLGLDNAGDLLSSHKDIQAAVSELPWDHIGKLLELFNGLSVDLQRAAANPSSLLLGDGCFAGCIASRLKKASDSKIRALEQESKKVSEELVEAHREAYDMFFSAGTTVFKGLDKVSDGTPQELKELKAVPQEFKRMAELAHACKFDEIDLSGLKKAADVSQTQMSISEAVNLMQLAKGSLAKIKGKVLKDVLDFVVGAPKRLTEAITGDLPFQCVRGLLPKPKFSESANLMFDKIKNMASLASQVKEGLKGSIDQTSAPDAALDFPWPASVEKTLQELSASLGEFGASVQQHIDRLSPAVEAAAQAAAAAKQASSIAEKATEVVGEVEKEAEKVASGFGGILQAGKESRGATGKDAYKFGDLTRGLVSEAKHLLGK